ncbi:hypothetical protein [Teichococcus oryzae]|uniref:hypothetical protein n=1 Tax=Teichococcus oryzae TaxID=1608942 RepID=UPI0013756A41
MKAGLQAPEQGEGASRQPAQLGLFRPVAAAELGWHTVGFGCHGGAGTDVLNGGGGNDLLRGSLGNDIFLYTAVSRLLEPETAMSSRPSATASGTRIALIFPISMPCRRRPQYVPAHRKSRILCGWAGPGSQSGWQHADPG